MGDYFYISKNLYSCRKNIDNTYCKRKQMQDNIVQLIEEQEAEQAQEVTSSET